MEEQTTVYQDIISEIRAFQKYPALYFLLERKGVVSVELRKNYAPLNVHRSMGARNCTVQRDGKCRLMNAARELKKDRYSYEIRMQERCRMQPYVAHGAHPASYAQYCGFDSMCEGDDVAGSSIARLLAASANGAVAVEEEKRARKAGG